MVYYGAYRNNKRNLKMLQAHFDTVTILEKYKEFKRANGRNYYLDDLYEDGLGEQINKLCGLLDIEIVLCNYIFQSKIFEYLPDNIFKIIDTHDVFTDKYKLESWFSFSKKDEAKGLDRADLVIAIQDNEKEYFKSISTSRVETVTHVEKPMFIEREYGNLARVGILSSGHKQDLLSIQEFLRHFKKYVRQENQNIELYLAGKVCERLPESETDIPQIKRLNVVKDLRDFYESVDLVLSIPLNGTGLKIKTVEALAYGKPLIATESGIEGIGGQSQFHKCKTMSEVFDQLRLIVYGEQTLAALASLSQATFLSYIEKNMQVINRIFPVQDKKEDSNYTKVMALYNELEYTKADDGFSMNHAENEAYSKLFELIDKLATTPFTKYPKRKYQFYKQMLDIFYSNR